MRIALSTSVMQRGQSGVGQYVLSLVRALLPHAAAHEFTLFVLEDDVPLFDFAAGSMRIHPVAERYRGPVRNILWHQATLPGLVRKLGIQVLHIPSYRRMLWPRPCPMVTTIHDLAPFRVPGKYDAMRTFYGKVVCRGLAARQDRIIAVSRTAAADITEFFGVDPDHMDVIPNGLDHERFTTGPKALARDAVCLPLGIREPFFLYVARLEHPAKNHSGLIEAFERYKDSTGSDWRLVLAGGDWHGADAIRRMARGSRHARDIILPGFVANADLPNWYRSADVFVFPSHFEGFGLPPIEAMACACPVLSSGAGALAETVAGACGSLDPNDPAQMAAQMTRATTDAAWRNDLRLAGLKRASEFSWKSCAEETIATYARVSPPNPKPIRHNGAGRVSSPTSGESRTEGLRTSSMQAEAPTPFLGRQGTHTR